MIETSKGAHWLCLMQTRLHTTSPADAWIMQPTPAAGLEVTWNLALNFHYHATIDCTCKNYPILSLACGSLRLPLACCSLQCVSCVICLKDIEQSVNFSRIMCVHSATQACPMMAAGSSTSCLCPSAGYQLQHALCTRQPQQGETCTRSSTCNCCHALICYWYKEVHIT